LFDPAKGTLIESVTVDPHNAIGVAFSPVGRLLISAHGGREAITVWDVDTWQGLMTLGGAGSLLDSERWSADGDVIFIGPPWQSCRAPSCKEIAEAEAKEMRESKQP
jgi:WD40 repeat protein